MLFNSSLAKSLSKHANKAIFPAHGWELPVYLSPIAPVEFPTVWLVGVDDPPKTPSVANRQDVGVVTAIEQATTYQRFVVIVAESVAYTKTPGHTISIAPVADARHCKPPEAVTSEQAMDGVDANDVALTTATQVTPPEPLIAPVGTTTRLVVLPEPKFQTRPAVSTSSFAVVVKSAECRLKPLKSRG